MDEFLSAFDNDWILEPQGELRTHKDVRLDIVSSRDFTIFSDDLNSATKLGQKISNAFVKKKPLNSMGLKNLKQKIWGRLKSGHFLMMS